jgi:hypothetical protein
MNLGARGPDYVKELHYAISSSLISSRYAGAASYMRRPIK